MRRSLTVVGSLRGGQRAVAPLGVLAGVVLLLAGLGSGSAAAQVPMPNPPHQFYGVHPETPITIDGEAAPDGTPVVVFDAEGAVLAEAVVVNGSWIVELEAGAGVVRFELGGLPSAGEYAVTAGGLTGVPLEVTTVEEGESPEGTPELAVAAEDAFVSHTATHRSFALVAGWNAISWPGEGVAAAALSAELGGATVMRWDAVGQRWEIFDPRLPEAFQTLASIEPGMSLWVRTESFQQLEIGLALDALAGETQTLRPGWNFVTWEGASSHPALAFEGLLDRIAGIFLFDAPTALFQTFLPGQPGFLSNLEVVPWGMPVWVLVEAGSGLEWNPWEPHDAA